MSEPFWIIFEWSKVGIRCYTLFYMPNSVWMDQNIILIRQTPNWMLFNLTDIPDNVQTIRIIFEWSKVGIGCYTLFHIPNSVWMDQNIILIGQTPNQMLFNLIDIPNIVQTIQNNF